MQKTTSEENNQTSGDNHIEEPTHLSVADTTEIPDIITPVQEKVQSKLSEVTKTKQVKKKVQRKSSLTQQQKTPRYSLRKTIQLPLRYRD